jgi:lysophospholipase L1-like esterase
MPLNSSEITILCYGDSNTRGSIPCTYHERYPRQIRWPGRLQQLLENGFHVIEEGLGGRTTCLDDPEEVGRNGKTSLLPCLRSHRPIDLVILALGTNDLKAKFQMPVERIAENAGELVKIIQTSLCGRENQNPKVLLIAPPPLGELTNFKNEFEGGVEKSKFFGELFLQEANSLGCDFLDAGQFIQSSNKDGIHWEPESHLKLAQVIAEKITSSLEN